MADDADTGQPGTNGAMRIDPALVRELAELLTENNLTEIEVEDGDRKIKVSRSMAPQLATATPMTPLPLAASTAPQASAAAPPPTETLMEDVPGDTVKSPMVGTAFLSPEPGARPFVSAGDTVKAGDTLLIIEAMKVMNPITAPASGIVRKILVSDAQPVEFDQPLVIVG